ncbi:heme exporter protein CcmD [Paraglaciecola sp. L1A13]|uniref:heme exporter protein CcmD n=1 Tax=Paraglaciecola sp. L1A13 TaxID=2686359 RepID=UPI00131C75AF|nr:heme exporter protein CcmD [Paraglaciecola sp. L1A13]|tara:strand:+ start:18570 stop:18827 length:258 start_codon:yes stop_codon:yes gene_type:complete
MQFDNLSAFFHMGGYAFYVWLSFGVSVLALVILAVDAVRQQKVLFDAVEKEQARKIRIKAAQASAKQNRLDTQNISQNEEVTHEP